MEGSFTAQEFGLHGITVNAYSPGIMDTPMSQLFLLLKCHFSSSPPTVDPFRATDGTSPLSIDSVSTP